MEPQGRGRACRTMEWRVSWARRTASRAATIQSQTSHSRAKVASGIKEIHQLRIVRLDDSSGTTLQTRILRQPGWACQASPCILRKYLLSIALTDNARY